MANIVQGFLCPAGAREGNALPWAEGAAACAQKEAPGPEARSFEYGKQCAVLVRVAAGYPFRDEVVLTICRSDRSGSASRLSSRKEVIQPQVLLRLPCYDLVPVTDLTLGSPEVGRLRVLPASMT
jgi:hypothetical protein